MFTPSFVDGILIVAVLILFISMIALFYERQNGHDGQGNKPEPTLQRQLEMCNHNLATAQQNIIIYKDLADKRKEIIERLKQELQNGK